MLPPTFITFQSHWSLFVFLASYLYIPHFIQSTVCENSDVCPLHPSWLIASLLLTHFKTDRTFLIYQIFFYLFIFFPVRVPPSLALSRGVRLFVREREQWGSEEKMVIARREDHSNAASPWNSCASASRTDAHMTRFFISPLHFFFRILKPTLQKVRVWNPESVPSVWWVPVWHEKQSVFMSSGPGAGD